MNKTLKLITALFLYTSQIALAQQKFMLQGWFWDFPKTYQGAYWADTINLKAKELKSAGFTDVWLPPLSLANTGAYSNGYDIRDLFNLGSTAYKTGFGTRTKVDALVANFNANGLRVMSDMVYNHRDGGALETNDAVGGWIKNYNLTKHNNGDQPYPSDRVTLVIPVGGNSGRGAAHYYFKIRSASLSSDYYNKAYTVLATTNKVGKKNLPNRNESAINGGGDCAQPHDTIKIGVTTLATIDNSGCGIDEFELVLDSLDFFASGDNIYISLYNPNGDYADQYIYGLWDAGNSIDIKDSVRYQTKTKFGGLRGQMNKLNFKPNGNPTCLCGDWDSPLFYFDYDQNVPSTRDTLYEWTKWMWTNVGARGFRIDAVKHFSPQFIGNMLTYLHNNSIQPSLFVGEFFDYNPSVLKTWTDNVKSNMSTAAQASIKPAVFDFSLQGALRDACDAFGYDARNVFTSGIVDGANGSAENTVTFVNNHDFRLAAQAVDNDKNLAYAYILTNNKVGTPCVFYPDYYDTLSNSKVNVNRINKLIEINSKYINTSSNREYLNRFGSPFTSNFLSGSAANSLIFQLSGGTSGCALGKDVIVAINFSGNLLKVDQQVNTGTSFNLSVGDTLIDILGNSAFPYAIVNANAQIYLQLPGRSYSVWVKGGLTKTPTIAASGSTTCCLGDSVLLSAGNGNNCYSYQWQLNNIDIDAATNSSYYAKSTGNYRVMVSQSGVLSKVSAPIFITVNIPAQAGILVQSDTLLSTPASQHQWFYSADSITYSAIGGATQQNYIVPISGYYYVQTTDGNGCNSSSFPVYINVTAVDELSNTFGLTLKPNPSFDGYFYLNASEELVQLEWKIYTLSGSLVSKGVENKLAARKNATINLSSQPAGTYYLELKSNLKHQTVTLIKQ